MIRRKQYEEFLQKDSDKLKLVAYGGDRGARTHDLMHVKHAL